MFITRKQYDYLIQTQPAWMEANWLGLNRRWNIAGVRVTGPNDRVKELALYL